MTVGLVFNANLRGYGSRLRIQSLEKYVSCQTEVAKLEVNVSVFRKVWALLVIICVPKTILKITNQKKPIRTTDTIGVYWYMAVLSPVRITCIDFVDCNQLFYRSRWLRHKRVLDLLKAYVFLWVEYKITAVFPTMVSGQADAERLREVAKNRVAFCANSNLYDEQFSICRTRLSTELLTIGLIADFSYQLNIDAFEDFQQMLESFDELDIKCLLAGKGSDKLEVRSTSFKKLGFVGDLRQEFYGKCDAVVLTATIGTSVPNKFYEALQTDLQIFCTDYFMSAIRWEEIGEGYSPSELSIYDIVDMLTILDSLPVGVGSRAELGSRRSQVLVDLSQRSGAQFLELMSRD